MPNKICVVVGSLREGSYNRRLVEAMSRLPVAEEFEFVYADLASLPHYSEEQDEAPPASVVALRELILECDGVLFATPEYNRSYPGVLKNAIDHASRPYGHSVWAGKPAGIIGVSIGATGTVSAQAHLRNVLAYLDMPVLAQPEAYIQWQDGLVAQDGTISEASRDFINAWTTKFLTLVQQHGPK